MTPASRVLSCWRLSIVLVGLALLPGRLLGQDSLPPGRDSLSPAPDSLHPDHDRTGPIASRADLEKMLAEAEQIAASDGYSKELRAQKQYEAALIKDRLSYGDFLPGDQITIQAIGDSGLSGTFTIQPGRVLTIPNFGDIPMAGVLRSEVNTYLKQQLSKYIKDPEIKARSLIRLSVLGGIAKPGFYQLDADMLLVDALQAAGGIGNGTDLKNSKVMRQEDEIIPKEVFYDAIVSGRSLDEINLRAGDEILVGTKSTTNWYTTLRTALLIPAAIISLYGLGRILGVF